MDPRFSGSQSLGPFRFGGSRRDPEHGETPPTRPRIWPALVLPILIFPITIVGAGVLASIVFGTLRSAHLSLGAGSFREFLHTTPGTFVTIIGREVMLGVVVLIAARFSSLSPERRLGLLKPSISLASLPLLILGNLAAIAAGVGLVAGLHGVGVPVPDPPRREVMVLLTASAQWRIPLIAAGSLLPGVFEELMYRGYIQTRLLERWHPAAAILVTSALFAAAHGSIGYALFVFPAGVWLGYVAWRSSSILPCMLCHAAVNAIFQGVVAPLASRHPDRIPSAIYFVIGMPLLVGTVFAIQLLERSGRARRTKPAPAAGDESAAAHEPALELPPGDDATASTVP